MNIDSIDENVIKESPVAIGHESTDKAVLKQKLIAIQVRASALRRQLNDVFNDEWLLKALGL